MAAGHDLFLSYNSRDREAVRVVQQHLQTRYVRAFLDREALVPGLPWAEALEEALGTVRAVAIFIGAYELGAWQKREMAFALDRQAREQQAGRRFPVIPVLVADSSLDKAPAFLLLNTWIDLRAKLDDPDALDALARTIRSDAGSPATSSSPAALCPYRGLRAFREEDALLFFGREACATELLNRLHAHKLVAVVGPSGSGKSSVMHAGLLPLLRRQRPPMPAYDTVTFTPGKRPFHSLAAALSPLWASQASKTDMLVSMERLGNGLASGEVSLDSAIALALSESSGTDRLLVIVDQFEELFTLTPPADRGRFVKTLLDCTESAPMAIALTLRADFYGRAIGLSRDLSDSIQQGLVNVGPMTREELRRAVENPAREAGLEFESGLVDRMLDHVEHQPGNLPLLEFALTELWERRSGRLLSHRGYDDSGGIEGAIGKRAEEQFSRLAPAEQATASRVFTRLVRVASATEEGTDTRQRISVSNFDARAHSVIQSFVTARLLVVSRDPISNDETVEIAHEALIRRWPRLREALTDDREFLLWRQRIGLTVNEWQHSGRDAGFLLRGALLAEARRLIRQRVADLNDLEREFVRRSDAVVRRSHRWAISASVIAALLTLGALGWAVWTRSAKYQLGRTVSEARTIIDASGSSMPEWVHTLTLTGRTREAFDEAATVPPRFGSAMLAEIALALATAGAREDALATALQVHDADDRSRALAGVLMSEGRTGGSRDVLRAADRIEDAFSLSPALVAAANDLLERQQSDEATSVARRALETAQKISDTYSKNAAVQRAVGILAATGATEEALDAASNIQDARWRASAISRVVESLAIRRTEEARPFGMSDPSIWSKVNALASAGRGTDAFELAFRETVGPQSSLLSTVVFVLSRMGVDTNSIVKDAVAAAQRVNATYLQLADLVARVEMLAKAGNDNEALERAQNIADKSYRCAALRKVVMALAEAGGLEQAVNIARGAEESCVGSMAYLTILEALLEQGRIEGARAFTREAFSAFTTQLGSKESTTRLAAAFAKIYGIRDTLRLMQYVRDDRYSGLAPERASGTAIIVEALARSATVAELLDGVRNIADQYAKSAALVKIAEILAAAGERARARSIVEEARLTARRVYDDSARSTAMVNVGRGFARFHFYQRAWELAQYDVSSGAAKVAIHTAIVREYHLERNPALAKTFERLATDLEKARWLRW
jgi:hypothetical protein